MISSSKSSGVRGFGATEEPGYGVDCGTVCISHPKGLVCLVSSFLVLVYPLAPESVNKILNKKKHNVSNIDQESRENCDTGINK